MKSKGILSRAKRLSVGLLLGGVTLSSQAAWLDEKLPEQTVGYLRLPQPTAGMTGTSMEKLFEHPANQKAAQQIITGLSALMASPDVLNKPHLAVILESLSSELEIMALPPANGDAPPVPNVLLTGQLNFADHAAVNKALQDLDKAEENVEVLKTISAEQDGVLKVGPTVVYLRFVADDKRFFMMGGGSVSEQLFKDSIASLQDNPKHPVLAEAETIESSGEGALLWVDIQKALPIVAANMESERDRRQLGMFKGMNSFTVGVGTAGDQGRTTIRLDAPEAIFRPFLPLVNNEFKVETRGNPHYVMSMGWPDAKQVQSIVDTAAKMSGDRSGESQYANAAKWFKDNIGVELDDLFNAVGPELALFGDDVGEFMAIKIRDRRSYERLLTSLILQGKWQRSTHDYDGTTINHIKIPNAMQKEMLAELEEDEPGLKPFLEMFTRLNRHLYYVEQDGYLVFSAVPQALMDRLEAGTNVSVAEWFKDVQHQNTRHSVLNLSTRFDDVNARFYYAYVQAVVAIGELLGQNVDPFSLPPLHDYDLPKDGAWAAQLDIDPRIVQVQLTYEISPLDPLYSIMDGNLYNVGNLIGAGFDIAMPVIMKQIQRDKVEGKVYRSWRLKRKVRNFYREHKRFPNGEEAATMSVELSTRLYEENSVVVTPETGVIRMLISDTNTSADGAFYIFTPAVDNGGSLDWTCTTAGVPADLIPSQCAVPSTAQ